MTRSGRVALLVASMCTLLAACGASGDGQAPYVTVLASATSALPSTSTTPGGAASSTTPRAQQLAGVCPNPLVIQLDTGMDMWATPYAALASSEGVSEGVRYRAALLDPIDRTPTGIDIELRTAAAMIGGSSAADVVLGDPSVFLSTADVSAVLPADRVRPAVVAAPWARGDLALRWVLSSDVSAARTIGDLAGSVITNPDLDTGAAGYLQASGLLPRKSDVGIVRPDATDVGTTGEVSLVHLLDDPARDPALVDGVGRRRAQLLAEVGWEPIPHALVARPASLNERQDCLRAVVPLVQCAVLRTAREPAAMTEHLVRINARMGITIAPDVARQRLDAALALGLLGVGSEAQPIVADVTPGRLVQIAKAQVVSSRVVRPRLALPKDVAAATSRQLDRRFLDSSNRFDATVAEVGTTCSG